MTAPNRGRSLFWTIAGMFLLTAVIGTAVQALVAVAVLRPLEAREARARGELAVSNIANEVASASRPPQGAELDSILDRHRELAGFRPGLIVFRGTDGTLTSAPPGSVRFLTFDSTAMSSTGAGARPAAGEPRLIVRSREPSRRFEVIARHSVVHRSTPLGEVQALRRVPSRVPGSPDARAVLLFLPIAIAVSIGAGLVVVRWLVARLRSMEVLAARVAEGDLTVRIADTSGDEIGRLAERLDRMTGRLAEARDQLAATEQQRRQLFADITHELATPLTSIRGLAETLLDPRVTVSGDERTHYVRGMLEESGRMDRLIRDLFELARLEAGAVALAREPLDWVALCRNTVERFQPRFRNAELSLTLQRAPAEAWIEADGHRLEQVLDNLLVNALRYVPAGGNVVLTLDPAPDNRYRLTVADDGPGLPADELPHLFDRFFRGAETRSDVATHDVGSGLGLAIVREIVERHGGTTRADAREPHGLAVAVELPAHRRAG